VKHPFPDFAFYGFCYVKIQAERRLFFVGAKSSAIRSCLAGEISVAYFTGRPRFCYRELNAFLPL
jgi:hypothetical protein